MPMKRTKSYVDLYRRTSPAKHVSRFLASLDARLWSYAAGALGVATLTDALRHVARGRIHRFRSRIVNMRQRRKETPLSASDAIN